MSKIEGIKLFISAGHYESDDEHSWLEPDFAQTGEVTFTQPFNWDDGTLTELIRILKNLYGLISQDHKKVEACEQLDAKLRGFE